MGNEKGNEEKNLWEQRGWNRSLAESERSVHSGSRYANKRAADEARSGNTGRGQKRAQESRRESRYQERTYGYRYRGAAESRYAERAGNPGQYEESRGSHDQERTERDRNFAETAAGLEKDSAGGRRRYKTAAGQGKNPAGKHSYKSGHGLDPVRLSLMALAAVIVGAYVVVAVYFGGHFYSGSQIYGIDCSRLTVGQVKQEVEEKIGEYTLTVEERGGQKDVITASQIGLVYQDENGIEKQLKKQRCYIWPAMLLLRGSGTLAIHTAYDRDNIDTVLKNMNCFLPGNIVAPQDAHRGDTETGYEVVPEVMGTTLDYTKTKEAIMEALDRGEVSISLEDAGCYIDPLVYQDDKELNDEVNELNGLVTARITYDFSDRQEVVDASVIKGWIVKDDDGSYYIDDNQIWAYVAQLASKYDTFGGSRTFYTSMGTTVSLSGGDYGWAIDQDATAQILSDDVKAGKTETITPEYVYTAMCRDENDIGDTYVEVCISMQEMWCYKDGELIVDTPVVTGNPNKGNETPAGGVWAIDAKMQDYVLRGEGYASPVDYWMPFNGDVGIHDMQNRAYFGGSIYLTNGSHGCVNTPYDAAQTIYNTVSIGTPVIVYE